ncbi:MAG TPA: GNAT family N-acetyltransferase [Amaricoccus sp.]|uniref:GNAT family N-acetyltransferase n=1 Tax=Amaricoccus sp. TaxID=1872485 RepID=UPI002BCBB11D|nr:GNAT family N-acetyltransferase [Amaricoccus sp.]HMQ92456.1 GNAT family N-acetyltransferase [Amaricoccus sp.]HMR53637.1 GNAT family N-acetyltransferase [Amaricoccus sp.]HMR61637.1 GNAT family N-acetyltransferase [Amaricoccus sp.]HMU00675.1 GNAT family N-acetyltransferase [Amaricoccus sp.]
MAIELHWSTAADSEALAVLHRDAWRYAYAGIIPGVALERMVARRGPGWWGAMHRAGGRALLLALDGTAAGYATLGAGRFAGRRSGEIHELYLRPEYHGAGLGRRLFTESRTRLRDGGLVQLLVWSLADNAAGCRFYRAMGGEARARGHTCIGGRELQKIAFVWD